MKSDRRLHCAARSLLVSIMLAAALAVTLVPASARAQITYQKGTAIGAGAVFGAVDLALITYDLVKAEQGKAPSRTIVFLELTGMTLQLVVGISMVATSLQSDSRLHELGIDRDLYLPVGALLATVAVPLAAHGLRHSTDRVGTGMHALRVVPARVGDARASGPGILVAGVF